MRLLLLTAAACGMLLAGHARADQLPCQQFSWSDMAGQFAEKPAVFKIVELSPVQREIATANYNFAPPASEEAFRHIYTAPTTRRPDVLVVFVRGDQCVADYVAFDADALAKLLTARTGA